MFVEQFRVEVRVWVFIVVLVSLLVRVFYWCRQWFLVWVVLIVFRCLKVFSSMLFFIVFLCRFCCDRWLSRCWVSSFGRIISMQVISGIQIIWLLIMVMISRKIVMNGRLLISVVLDEVKNLCIDLNFCIWVLKVFIDVGLVVIWVFSMWENSRVESCRLRCLLSMLSRWLCMICRILLRMIVRVMLLVRIYRVLNVVLGIMWLQICMVNSVEVIVRMLVINVVVVILVQECQSCLSGLKNQCLGKVLVQLLICLFGWQWYLVKIVVLLYSVFSLVSGIFWFLLLFCGISILVCLLLLFISIRVWLLLSSSRVGSRQ